LYFTPGREIEADVKRDLFDALLRQQPAWLRGQTHGDLMSRMTSDTNMVRLFAGFGVMTVINVVFAILAAGGQMMTLSPSLALLLLAPIAVAFGVVQVLIRRLFVLIRLMQRQLGELSDQTLATLRGMATVQGFAAEAAFLERFEAKNRAYEATNIERSRIRSLLAPTLILSASFNLFLLLAVGGQMAIRGEITVGELVAFATLVNLVTGPLRQSSFLVSVMQQCQASWERIDGVLAAPPLRPDLPSPAPAPTAAPGIVARHLTFTWPGASQPALSDVSFTLQPGATLGVFGATGSGKSTLLRLLARLEDPPPGALLIDGVCVRTLDLDAWRRALSLVPQRPFLFSESLADNLLLGDDAPGRLDRALALGALAPDVARLPEGTATVVGESGVRLSGGQRQRAALARGLLRPHLVVLLDDVLSAVDHATEAELIERLREEAAGGRVTTVLVSHRVSALLHTDHVIVLDQGRVVDQGAPHALLQRPGPLQDAWRQQRPEEVG
jgi:ATP-binding cassette subfamily B protein